jgi:AraC family transcriptional regulator
LIIPKWRIRRAQEFIRENLADGISLKEIAEAAGDVSPYHFARLFKQATGFSPYQFLLECRVLTAQQLLRAKRELSLGEIAFRCGFADQSSFTRCSSGEGAPDRDRSTGGRKFREDKLPAFLG